jgi:general secretion pathway protein H
MLTLHTVNRSSKLNFQRGFTLIELMVVLVIMGVVVSVGVISLGSFNQDLAENQRAIIGSYLQQVSDESAFNQRLFLVTPDEDGLMTYWFKDNQWQVTNDIEKLPWQKGLNVDWDIDETLAKQQQLPNPGWLFWPTGEVTPGQIELKGMSEDTNESIVINLIWNEALEFEKQ